MPVADSLVAYARWFIRRVDWRTVALGTSVTAALALYLLQRHDVSLPPAVLLVDNGSLRPASTLSLRRVALRLSAKCGLLVVPTSARFSDRLGLLEGVAPESTEVALKRLAGSGIRRTVILPLFVGPSDTISDFLPGLVSSVSKVYPRLQATIASPLVCRGPKFDGAVEIARILEAHVRATAAAHPWSDSSAPLHVAVCDHGTPSAAVNAVRNHLAELMAAALSGAVLGGVPVASVRPCSMERRPAPEFDFNDPTLEAYLAGLIGGGTRCRVVVAMLFVSPGKHAEAGGDVASIISRAVASAEGGLEVTVTPLLADEAGGGLDALGDLLAKRLKLAMLPQRSHVD